jgi:DNA-binding transcriptional regulator YiaG
MAAVPRSVSEMGAPNGMKISASEIRKIRKAMDFSQEEFARFLWVTYSTLNRWEAGRATPFGLHLRILTILQKNVSSPSFRAALRDPRMSDPLFLLYRLLKLLYAGPNNDFAHLNGGKIRKTLRTVIR